MSYLETSFATFRIFGDLLVPGEISRLLGSEPTRARQKGDEIVVNSTGRVRIAKDGMWSLAAERREPEDLCGQIDEILGKLTDDLDVWADIRRRFRIDLFCGLFMASSNDGASLTPEHLLALGNRGIALVLDIYDPSDE